MSDTGRPEPQRLAKRLAAQLSCSRSDAENYIAGGFVRVDGVVVEAPMARVRDEQLVTLDPKAKLESLASVTLIWHKPAGHALPDLSPTAPYLPDALAAQWFAPDHRFKADRSGCARSRRICTSCCPSRRWATCPAA